MIDWLVNYTNKPSKFLSGIHLRQTGSVLLFPVYLQSDSYPLYKDKRESQIVLLAVRLAQTFRKKKKGAYQIRISDHMLFSFRFKAVHLESTLIRTPKKLSTAKNVTRIARFSERQIKQSKHLSWAATTTAKLEVEDACILYPQTKSPKECALHVSPFWSLLLPIKNPSHLLLAE